MSIFESKPRIFWRKVRSITNNFFAEIGDIINKFCEAFRVLPKSSRRIIGIGSSVLVLLIVFAVFWWPVLQRTGPAPEGSPPETVAEAIDRITINTQRTIDAEEIPALIDEIEQQITRSIDDDEIWQLMLLQGRVFFNAGQFLDAARAYQGILV